MGFCAAPGACWAALVACCAAPVACLAASCVACSTCERDQSDQMTPMATIRASALRAGLAHEGRAATAVAVMLLTVPASASRPVCAALLTPLSSPLWPSRLER